jgi:hypothetical protein
MSSINVKPKTGVINYEEHVGDTLFMRWNWQTPDANGIAQTVNMSGYSSKLQIKTQKTDSQALLTLTSANGEIVLGGTPNNIDITISANQTSMLGVGSFFYDCQFTDSLGYVNTLVEGKIKLLQDTTR